ncbi:MAG: type II toxin-antitoxin system YafQ family toxin [Lachnospiraceae bacterium]|nr:type II toxin-antitoxin system YafQ family toxin [Lachnospiraceae bacterium]
MLKLNTSTKFKKDYKLCLKRGYDMHLLQVVIDTLRIPAPLPVKNQDHNLSGNHAGERECHIAPDWLLIYRVYNEELYLIRTGTHADVLNM